jgi:hypothetical protein
MKLGAGNSRVHPDAKALALYATSDLPWRSRWVLHRHISRCSACDEQVALFRTAIFHLRKEAREGTLTGFESATEWSRMEREMIGNIGVGLAAARCIENVGHKRRLFSRGALVTFALALLFAIGWFTHIPAEQNQRLAASLQRLFSSPHSKMPGTVIEATQEGIAVRTQGATMKLMHPPSAVVSMAGSSAITARYVDEDTGEVTITHVYGQ